jgi:hypothetical protein
VHWKIGGSGGFGGALLSARHRPGAQRCTVEYQIAAFAFDHASFHDRASFAGRRGAGAGTDGAVAAAGPGAAGTGAAEAGAGGHWPAPRTCCLLPAGQGVRCRVGTSLLLEVQR